MYVVNHPPIERALGVGDAVTARAAATATGLFVSVPRQRR
mgnify:CR=1 FL=1